MNDVWAMDFLSDKLFDGRPFRILTIVDCHTREALATVARTNFRAYQDVEEFDRVARQRGKPRSIRVDNGPEFAGRMLDHLSPMEFLTTTAATALETLAVSAPPLNTQTRPGDSRSSRP